jgi:tRNA/rRNA methyltransferase
MKRCRVVLVGTQIAANLGSVARLMRNFGASDLVLVAPEANRLEASARQTATHHADDLLEGCGVVDTLEEAVADCIVVTATSARTGGLFRRQTVGSPGEIAARLVEAMPVGPVALVFGPERTGLTNEDVVRCPYLIHIPTDGAYPALNLAQAAAICLYEVRKAWLGQQRGEVQAEQNAEAAQQARMFSRLQSGLEQIHFLRGVRGEALMHALRHLIVRARPSPMEVRLLFGLARQLHWVAEQALESRRDRNVLDSEGAAGEKGT